MNTKRLPADDEPLIPELELPADALYGGPEALAVDAPDAMARYIEMRLFNQPDLSFFKLPIFYELRQRPYHLVVVQGPFDTRRLAHDHRRHIYRSEVICLQNCKPSVESLLLCLGHGVFVLQDGNDLTVVAPTPQAAVKVAADFRKYVKPRAKAKPGFYLVSFGPNGPCAELVAVDACPAAGAAELALHYGADFVTWEKQWLARLAKRHSGVTILVGPPGVGKTSYLKMLMARFISRFAFYYLPLSSFDLLSAPAFVGFWLDQNRLHKGKAKVAIIEDAENLLLPRDERSRAQVSNLLNIGDGFLGEHLKLHVVATTNAPLRRLDEAVLRPGRLMGTREFRRLSRAEALRLAQAKGLTLAGASDTWSLAEIYHGQQEVLDARMNATPRQVAQKTQYRPLFYIDCARVNKIAKSVKGIQTRFGTVQDSIYRSDGKRFSFPREIFHATQFIHEQGLRGQHATRGEIIFALSKVLGLRCEGRQRQAQTSEISLCCRIAKRDFDCAKALLAEKPIVGLSSVAELSRKLLLDFLVGKLTCAGQERKGTGVPVIAAPLDGKCLRRKEPISVVLSMRITRDHANQINATLKTKPIEGVFSRAQLVRRVLLDFLTGELSYREPQDWGTDPFTFPAPR